MKATKSRNQYFKFGSSVVKRTSNRHYYDRFPDETGWIYAPGLYDCHDLNMKPITSQQAIKLLAKFAQE